MTAKQLEAELGRGEAIGAFIAECEVVLSQIDPTLDYNRADLQGFVRGAWLCEGVPVDVASEFAEALDKQRTAKIILDAETE